MEKLRANLKYNMTKQQIGKFEKSLAIEEKQLVLQQAVVDGIKSQLEDLYQEAQDYEQRRNDLLEFPSRKDLQDS